MSLPGLKLLLAFVIISQTFLAQVPDLIPYRKGKLWGYCNRDKKNVIPVTYNRAFPFVKGKALVETVKNICLQIDTTGRIIQTLPYNLNDYITNSGWFRISTKTGKTGLISLAGNIILPAKYDGVEVFGRDSFEVKLNGKKGTINSKEKILKKFVPYNTDEMFDMIYTMPSNKCNDNPCFYGEYNEGMAVIGYKGKFGYTDSTKKIVIECKYNTADAFLYGLGRVMFDRPGQKKEPATKTKEGVMVVHATLIDEGYVDRLGNEYWED